METRLTDDTPGFKSAIRKRLLQQKSICPKAQTAPAATDWCLEVSCRMSGRICAGSGCHVIYGPCNRISSRLLAHPDAARSQKCHHSDTDDFTQCLMNWWRHCAVPRTMMDALGTCAVTSRRWIMRRSVAWESTLTNCQSWLENVIYTAVPRELMHFPLKP